MLLLRAPRSAALRSPPASLGGHARRLSTLPSNPNIYVHPTTSPSSPHETYTLTLTPTTPPHAHLALGTTTALPVTPRSFRENPHFLKLVHSVLRTHAILDPTVRGAAAAYASSAGATLGSGGAGFIANAGSGGGLPPNHPAAQAARQAAKRSRPSNIPGSAASPTKPSPSSSSSPSSAYGGGGGAGGGGRGGWVHVSDERRAPEYGRIAWPEDIFGSVEVDGRGEFVDEGGNYQESGTYRIVTNEGVLGLSGYLMGKVRAAVEELEKQGTGR